MSWGHLQRGRPLWGEPRGAAYSILTSAATAIFTAKMVKYTFVSQCFYSHTNSAGASRSSGEPPHTVWHIASLKDRTNGKRQINSGMAHWPVGRTTVGFSICSVNTSDNAAAPINTSHSNSKRHTGVHTHMTHTIPWKLRERSPPHRQTRQQLPSLLKSHSCEFDVAFYDEISAQWRR